MNGLRINGNATAFRTGRNTVRDFFVKARLTIEAAKERREQRKNVLARIEEGKYDDVCDLRAMYEEAVRCGASASSIYRSTMKNGLKYDGVNTALRILDAFAEEKKEEIYPAFCELVRCLKHKENIEFLASIVRNNEIYAGLILNRAVSDMSLLVGYVWNTETKLRGKIERLVENKKKLGLLDWGAESPPTKAPSSTLTYSQAH